MARKFLYVIATLVVLALAGLTAYRLYGPQLIRFAMVPSAPFEAQKPMAATAWADRKMWFVRPDLPGNPALWLPDGFKPQAIKGDAVVFYIHPTSYLRRTSWNAPLDNAEANDFATLIIRGQASAFNNIGDIWAPRYRQATFGAFLTRQKEGQQALDLAYGDVVAAWDAFLANAPANQPIVLAGHSQGSVHLLRLLRERIAGQPVARRVAAIYVIGWPVSVTADLPALGFPACARADQPSCIMAWQSFAEPAETSQWLEAYDSTTGFTGMPRRGSKMLCTNPLTGTIDATAPAGDNIGSLVPSSDLKTATMETGKIPARCDPRGFLLIGPPPENIGTYVLPGNNYHVFDYALFWSNLRSDAARRLAAFEKR